MLAQLPHHMMWRSRLSCGSSAARTGLGAPRLPTLPAPSARRPLTNYRVRHASSDAAVTTIGPAEALLSACRSRCSYFVHFGNCIVLLAINQTDMMHLRGLSIGASCCGIAYNMLQPNPLVAPALWGVFFIGCHTYQISILLREQQEVRLSDDEEAAYQRAFVRFGFTPRQFLDILEAAQPPPPAEGGAFATHGHGATIHARGSPMDTISFVLEGEVEMVSTSICPILMNRLSRENVRITPAPIVVTAPAATVAPIFASAKRTRASRVACFSSPASRYMCEMCST